MLEQAIRDRIAEHVAAETQPRARLLVRALNEAQSRQVATGMLGSSRGRITTHYSAPEIDSLLAGAEKVAQARVGVTLVRVAGV